MALAAALHKGFTYKVTEGPLEGELVTIVDNVAVPDGQPNQRKVLVEVGGQPYYIIPRQIDGTPVTAPARAAAPVAAPVAIAASVAKSSVVTAQDIQEVAPGVVEYSPITDPMDVRLDHLRPSISKVKTYVNREMPGGMTDVQFLLTFTNDAYRAKNQGRPANVMLKGDTQGGKTFLVEVLAVMWAEQLGFPKPMPIFTISGSSGVTDYDLFGQPASYYDPIRGTEHIVWLPGQVDMWAHVGGILYIDEANALGERVTTSLHPVADHRHEFTNRNRPVKVPGDGFMAEVVTTQMDGWIIGTFNEGYRGMSDMNEAFLRRFRQIEWGYDKKVEQALVASATIHLLADAMRTARAGSKVRTPVGTATLEQLELDVASFGTDLALELFVSAFKTAERPVVRQIIEDRSIKVLLNEEIRGNNLQNMGVL
jgi:MoxR-like ATPase